MSEKIRVEITGSSKDLVAACSEAVAGIKAVDVAAKTSTTTQKQNTRATDDNTRALDRHTDATKRLKRSAFELNSALSLAGKGLAGLKLGVIITGAPLAADALGDLAGGLVAIASGSGPAAAGLVSVAQGATLAAQVVGTLKLATHGIADALKEQTRNQQQSGAAATTWASQQAASAARVKSAHDSLTQAQHKAAVAERGLTLARAEGRRELEALRDAAESSAISEQRAEIALRQAIEARRQLRNTGASADELRSADLDVEDARMNVQRAHREHADASKAAASTTLRTTQAMTKASQQVTTANQGVTRAHRQLTAAQRAAAAAAKSHTAALVDQNAAFNKLPKSAQAFVRQLQGMRPLLDELRTTAADGFLPGAGEGLTAASKNFGHLNKIVGLTSSELGLIAKRSGEALGSDAFGKDFEKIGRSNVRVLDDLAHAGGSLFHVLDDLLVAGRPLTEWLSENVKDGAASAEAWTKHARATGQLRDIFKEAQGTLKTLGSIAGNVGHVVGAVLGTSYGTGKGLLHDLDQASQKWSDWTDDVEHKQAMKHWFEQAGDTIRAAGKLIGGVAKAWAELSGNDKTDERIDKLRTGLLPAIKKILEKLNDGEMTDAVIDLVTNTAKIVANLQGAGDADLTGVVKALAKMAGYLADASDDSGLLAETLSTLGPTVGGIVVAKKVSDKLGISDAIKDVGTLLGRLSGIGTGKGLKGKLAILFGGRGQTAGAPLYVQVVNGLPGGGGGGGDVVAGTPSGGGKGGGKGGLKAGETKLPSGLVLPKGVTAPPEPVSLLGKVGNAGSKVNAKLGGAGGGYGLLLGSIALSLVGDKLPKGVQSLLFGKDGESSVAAGQRLSLEKIFSGLDLGKFKTAEDGAHKLNDRIKELAKSGDAGGLRNLSNKLEDLLDGPYGRALPADSPIKQLPKQLEELNRQVTAHSRTVAGVNAAVGTNWRDMARDTHTSLADVASTVALNTGIIKTRLGADSHDGKVALAHNLQLAVDAIEAKMASGAIKAKTGMKVIRDLVSGELKDVYGYSDKQVAGLWKNHDAGVGPQGLPGPTGTPEIDSIPRHARGYYQGQPGQTGGDYRPALIGDGEAVINAPQQGQINTALAIANQVRPDLVRAPSLNGVIDAGGQLPHWAASSDAHKGAARYAGGKKPWHTLWQVPGHFDHLHVDVAGGQSVKQLIALGKRLQGRGFQVGENAAFGDPPAPGVHSATGYHYRFGGRGALDVNHDQGNESTALSALAAQLAAGLMGGASPDLKAIKKKIRAVGGGGSGVVAALVRAALGPAKRAAIASLETAASSSSSGGGGAEDYGFTGSWPAVLTKIAKARNWSAADWRWIVEHESGGVPGITNSSSGATGLGQMLGSNIAKYHGRGTPVEQIEGMGDYIRDRYGNPTKAKSFWQAHNWYGRGKRARFAGGKKGSALGNATAPVVGGKVGKSTQGKMPKPASTWPKWWDKLKGVNLHRKPGQKLKLPKWRTRITGADIPELKRFRQLTDDPRGVLATDETNYANLLTRQGLSDEQPTVSGTAKQLIAKYGPDALTGFGHPEMGIYSAQQAADLQTLYPDASVEIPNVPDLLRGAGEFDAQDAAQRGELAHVREARTAAVNAIAKLKAGRQEREAERERIRRQVQANVRRMVRLIRERADVDKRVAAINKKAKPSKGDKAELKRLNLRGKTIDRELTRIQHQEGGLLGAENAARVDVLTNQGTVSADVEAGAGGRMGGVRDAIARFTAQITDVDTIAWPLGQSETTIGFSIDDIAKQRAALLNKPEPVDFSTLTSSTSGQQSALDQLTIGRLQAALAAERGGSLLRGVIGGFQPMLGRGFIGAYAHGGPIRETGMALLHKGEYVVPDPRGPYGALNGSPQAAAAAAPVVQIAVTVDAASGRASATVDGRAVDVTSQRLGQRTRALIAAPGLGR